jgi:ferredoxin-NADP reductase/Na+-translocating ferredoxin:NAD+ oxidoreductase RnfD subunit
MKYLDSFLNSITMYRLLIYGLGVLVLISIILSWLGYLYFSPGELMLSTLLLGVVCNGTNFIFAKIVKAPINIESASITALILTFLLAPPTTTNDFFMIAIAGSVAMASKYILAINKKHLFNPAAVGAVVIGVLGSGLSIWWVGSSVMFIFVAIFGLLVVRKIRRFELFLSFIVVSYSALIIPRLVAGNNWGIETIGLFSAWPLLFFGTIMLTEPLTSPPTKKLQIIYGALVGFLFSSQFSVGKIYSSPEVALVIGNIFSYVVSPKQKLKLLLKSSQALSKDVYEFIFITSQKFIFTPGQFLEWTMPKLFLENRGNRRYFTIASSPTEDEVRLGIRVFPESSRFKKELMAMDQGETMWVSQLAGDFILPSDKDKKILFIAGGIGITPFRSMIKYLLDKNEVRDIVLIYACWSVDSFVYQDIFAEAEKMIGIKIIYLITNLKDIPVDWQGKTGFLNKKLLPEIVPDYLQRMAFLSGPNNMVTSYKKLLINMGVKNSEIKKDYFPGF